MADVLLEQFRQQFGPDKPTLQASAPGRVNLIGEHTDYNGGYVMPMALDRRVTFVCRPRADRRVVLYSTAYNETAAFALDRIERASSPLWPNYPKGVARVLRDEGYDLLGMDALIAGDVPLGAGLSSSAAFEIAAMMAFVALAELTIDPMRMAKLGQRAENEFVGMRCGLMDQFIAVHGRAGHAVFLDCETLAHEAVPLDAGRAAVIVCDTGVKHELASSAYNERRAQCEEAIRRIAAARPAVRSFHDLTPETFGEVEAVLDGVLLKRARHVVAENARVLASIVALKAGRLDEFGRLMNASHESLRTDYQVSCEELDLMVELARGEPATLGARLTGGGFGGCTVNLVRRAGVAAFREHVPARYRAQTGLEARVFVVQAGDGARCERL